MNIYEEGILNSILTNEKSEIWVNITNKDNNKIYLNATLLNKKIEYLRAKIPCEVGFKIDTNYLPATKLIDIFEKSSKISEKSIEYKINKKIKKTDDIKKCICELYSLMREGCKCGGS